MTDTLTLLVVMDATITGHVAGELTFIGCVVHLLKGGNHD